MPDAMAEREAREVIAEHLWSRTQMDEFTSSAFLVDADQILTALAEAGYEVGRWEQVGRGGFVNEHLPGPPSFVTGREMRDFARTTFPIFRRVEGGATGEQTE